MENKKQTFCIESLKEKHKVSEAVFEGTKAAEGWRKSPLQAALHNPDRYSK